MFIPSLPLPTPLMSLLERFQLTAPKKMEAKASHSAQMKPARVKRHNKSLTRSKRKKKINVSNIKINASKLMIRYIRHKTDFSLSGIFH